MTLSQKQIEFLRFCLVGVVATAIHYGIYLSLNKIINTTVAYSIGYGISFCANFLLSNYFTFKTKPSTRKGLGFALSHLINYLLHIGLLNLFIYCGTHLLHLQQPLVENLAPIPVFAITIPINFLLVRTVLKYKKANRK